MITIDDSDIDLLTSLFEEAFDEPQCLACHKSLGSQANIAVHFGQETLVFPAGIEHETQSPGVKGFDSIEDLRAAVSERLLPKIKKYSGILSELNDSSEEFLRQGWRELTPAVFAAARLAMTVALPSITVSTLEGETAWQVLDRMALLQAKSWFALCLQWASPTDHPISLEQDLASYVQSGAILPSAPEQLFILLDNFEQRATIKPPLRFAMEATRATICSLANIENAHEKTWAKVFLDQEVLLAAAGDPPAPLRASAIGAERASKTIGYEAAFNAVAHFIAERGPGLLEFIARAAAKAGWKDVPQDVLNAFTITDENKLVEAGDLLKVLTDVAGKHEPAALLPTVGHFLGLLIKQNRVPDAVWLADELEKHMGNNAEFRAGVEFRLTSALRHVPQLVLDRLGDTPATWEEHLGLHLRLHLLVERAMALNLVGRPQEAIAALEQEVIAIASDPNEENADLRGELRRQLAMLYRRAGRQEQALQMLQEVSHGAGRNRRLLALDAEALLFIDLGRPEDAIAPLNEALTLARGPLAHYLPKIEADRALALAASGRKNEAVDGLLRMEEAAVAESAVLLSYVSAWLTCSGSDRLATPEARRRAASLITQLNEARQQTYDRREMTAHMQIVRALATISDAYLPHRKNVFWQLVDAAAREFELGPDSSAIVALARHNYANGNTSEALNRLRELPVALRKMFGGNVDLALTLRATHHLETQLSKLAHAVLEREDDLEMARVIAELNRDVLGKIFAARALAGAQLDERTSSLATDEAIQKLPIGHEQIAVIEWLDDGDIVKGFLTRLQGSDVSTRWLNAPPVDLVKLRNKMLTRLQSWLPDSKEDPFDFSDWQQFEAWLREVLRENGQHTHLVVLELEDFAGIPWHVAAGGKATVSYAPSWAALLDIHDLPARPAMRSIGIAMAPGFGDSSYIVQALEESLLRSTQLARVNNLTVSSFTGTLCDREAMRSMLQQVDVAKILCHGFVERRQREVAWMVAHNGASPPVRAVAAAHPDSAGHRFSWRDCQRLASSPKVVFSAACSSGTVHIAGLGESLGLFSALRRCGTRAIVAPRWNIDPHIVLPILDQAMEDYIVNGRSLAAALADASAHAGEEKNRWLACALAIEGDWR